MALLYMGQMLNYQPMDASGALPLAAMVIGATPDGKADLRVFLGFGQGTMDIKGVAAAADAANPDPGTYFPPMQFKETRRLNQPLNNSTDDTVVLENASSAANGDILRIDQEEMTVTDATDPNNLIVSRGTNSTLVRSHAVGALVLIGVQ